jgi:Predicted aminopeptidases
LTYFAEPDFKEYFKHDHRIHKSHIATFRFYKNKMLEVMKRSSLFGLLLPLIAISCSNPIEKAANTISSMELSKDISVLASDSLQGRGLCSIGETRTLNYLQSRMKELGLEPAFGTSYLQRVPLVKISSSVENDLVINSSNSKQLALPQSSYTAWSSALQQKIAVSKSEIIFVGFGIDAPEYKWNDFEGLDVRGKTIVVLVNDPGYYTHDSSMFQGNAMTYYGRWRYKFEEAERMGAAACFIVHEDGPAGYPWSVVNRHNNTAAYFLDDSTLSHVRCLVQGWFTVDAARQLFVNQGYNFDSLKKQAIGRSFKPVDLGCSLTINMSNSWAKCSSYNVGGVIRGRISPEENIVYSGHWDHLGIGPVVDGDSIYNGASDNAAAIAWMFSIAKAFQHLPQSPDKSVLFLIPTAEESGMLGSDYYVQHPAFPMDSTIACLNTDVTLFLGRFKDVTVTGLGYSQLDSLLAFEAAKQGRYVCGDPNPENGMFYRSDQLPFLKAGVPALFAKGYSDQRKLGKKRTMAKIETYWKSTYHKPSDEFVPSRDNLDGLVEDSKLFFKVGLRILDEKNFPKWNKGSEFYRLRSR